MGDVTFGILLFSVFLAGLFSKSVGERILRAIGAHDCSLNLNCRDNNRPVSIDICEKQDFRNRNGSRSDELHILGSMWFYMASNDERDMQIYSPTPLQDIDPQNLA
ncbi:MAG: hypothetical protein LBJ45_03255 [Holosporaceae bacterium]|jgi:hypothetical protein|nr:hypothetical protein [Holosporaceae bacterium]